MVDPAAGTTETSFEFGDTPTLLLAATWYQYVLPLLSPVSVYVVVVPLRVAIGGVCSPSSGVPGWRVYGVGLPLELAVQLRATEPLPGVAVRPVGPLGTEAVAGVAISWSTRETPWSLTASMLTEFTPAFR